MKIRNSLFAAAFVVLSTNAVSATPVELNKQPGGLFGGVGARTVTISNDGSSLSAKAGGFRLNDGVNDLIAWCLDISHYLSLPGDYITTGSPFSNSEGLDPTQKSNVENLFKTGYSQDILSNKDASAGFQLALWELVYETASDFDVTSGGFYASATTAALNAANGFLDNLGNAISQELAFTYYESTEGGQNLVSATPVPLPAAVLFLGSGLAGLFWAGRRKKDQGTAA